jgi:8-oxo-dGTP pyrophosphatase MutT (NUDIX family)
LIQRFQVATKAIIVRNGQLLVVKSRVKGKWDLIGGRIEDTDTTPVATLAREIDEELPGVTDVHIGALLGVARIHDVVFPDDSQLMLLMYAVSATLPAGLSEEHTESRWVGLGHAREMGSVVRAAAQFLIVQPPWPL